MSSTIFDEGRSYTIPADSLDLNCFSKYFASSTKILPLWTKSRLNGEGGYCQVKILTQSSEECYSEPIGTYECHICNIHVPVTCTKEHNDSKLHKTFKNITQKVLENLSKQMDTSIFEDGIKLDNDVYYCVPCSRIIKKENREKHEYSEFHAKSNKDSIIVSEFYKILNEDRSPADEIIIVEEKLTEPVNTKCYTQNCYYGVSINELNNYLYEEFTSDPTCDNKLTAPGPSENDSKIQSPNDMPPGPSKNYNKIQLPNDATPGPSKNYNKIQPPNDATPGTIKMTKKSNLQRALDQIPVKMTKARLQRALEQVPVKMTTKSRPQKARYQIPVKRTTKSKLQRARYQIPVKMTRNSKL